MLKKAKAELGALDQARELSQSVLHSSRQIWLAGLGAFARAQQGGTKVFETLVEQGEHLESKTRQAAVDTAAAARGAATAKAKEVQRVAGGTWDKLEQVFEDRVAQALAKLGVHSKTDVERLTARVDALAEAVNRLINATPGAREAPAKRAAKRAAPTKPARTSAAKAGLATGRGTAKPAAKKSARKTVAAPKPAAKRATKRAAPAPSTPAETPATTTGDTPQ